MPPKKNLKIKMPKTEPISEVVMGPATKEEADVKSTIELEMINGRFSMMTNTKYAVTVGEIERRMGSPESLNSSLLSGVLRRSKTKNCGGDMRAKLHQHGIELDLCKRNNTTVNSLTGLCEEEVIKIAEDLKEIVEDTKISEEMAKYVVKNDSNENHDIASDARDFLDVMKYMRRVMNRVTPPLGKNVGESSARPLVTEALNRFSLHTHGLGILTAKMWTDEAVQFGEKIVSLTTKPKKKKARKSKTKSKSKN